MRSTSHSTEYDLVGISGNKYWLPVHSSVEMQLVSALHQQMDFYKVVYGESDPSGYSGYQELAKNDMEYRDYRKFNTEIRLVTDQK